MGRHVRGQPCRTRGCRKRCEIDVAGEVGLAGIEQRVNESMAAHGLKGVAEARLQMPVVEKEAGAAVFGYVFIAASAPLGPAPLQRLSDRGRIATSGSADVSIAARPATKVSSPSSVKLTQRSSQPPSVFKNCRTGMASNSSLPTMNRGRFGGRSSTLVIQRKSPLRDRQRGLLHFGQAGLVSIKT